MTLILRPRHHWGVLSTPFEPSSSCYCFGILWPMNFSIPHLKIKYYFYYYILIMSVHVCKMFFALPEKNKTKQGWQFRAWISSPRPARLYYMVSSRISELCVALKITQQLRLLGIPLLLLFHVRPCEPAYKKLGRPWFRECFSFRQSVCNKT
jgi:hypothetical protein